MQVDGQKSIVSALLRLTNITKTLLEDKEREQVSFTKPHHLTPPLFYIYFKTDFF